MKRIYGKLTYFTGTAEEALEKYEKHMETLAPTEPGENQMRHMLEKYMCDQDDKRNQGQLSKTMFLQYKRMCDTIIQHFGRLRPLDSLTRDDAASLRSKICKGRSIKTQHDRINLARIVFRWGLKKDFLAKPFHEWIENISKRTLKRYQAQRPPRTMTAKEIRALLDAAKPQMKAMILLAINCGMGNSDLADLSTGWLDLDGGWHTFPRPKTGETRKGKLWPVTVDAIRHALTVRPTPRKAEHKDRLFITRKHGVFVNADRSSDAIGKEFAKLVKSLGLQRPKFTFYSLRHMHETIGSGCCDQVALNLSMGHCDNSMAANYRAYIEDERLEKLADHIHRWLFDCPMSEGAVGLKVVG
jgi:integrase